MNSSSGEQAQSPLVACNTFVIPRSLLDYTLDVLAEAGKKRNEAFVVWGAVVDDRTVTFRSAVRPQQRAHKTRSGLLVTVEGEALFEVNRELYQRGEVLAGQVHSHPTDAFHSDTDDCFSLVTLTGALSVVIPDFARDGLADVRSWAWYRLTGQAQWTPLTSRDRIKLDPS